MYDLPPSLVTKEEAVPELKNQKVPKTIKIAKNAFRSIFLSFSPIIYYSLSLDREGLKAFTYMPLHFCRLRPEILTWKFSTANFSPATPLFQALSRVDVIPAHAVIQEAREVDSRRSLSPQRRGRE
jgi:hypothetical protein